jgi:hypothetical protein
LLQRRGGVGNSDIEFHLWIAQRQPDPSVGFKRAGAGVSNGTLSKIMLDIA